MASRARLALLGVGFVLILATCRDGMEPEVHLAPIAVAPVLPSDAALASFGLAIDRVRFIVVRPSATPDTLADTTVALPPDSATLDIDIRVPLIAAAEVLEVSVVVLSGTIPLFEGTAPVKVTSGAPPAAPTEIPVQTYVGPGAGVDSLAITPAAPFLFFNDSLRFQVEAFQGGVPVPQFYVAWNSSDPLLPINGVGTLRAPATRGGVRVRARTPSGAADSVEVTFVPLPTQLVIIGGTAQTGVVGQTLDVPLEVEVRASDNLAVGGVNVRFQAPAGGAPADVTVPSDANGRARVVAVLGPTAGIQSFQASLPGFVAVPSVAFGVPALAGPISATASLLTVANATVASGSGVVLTLRAKDANGNTITTGGATVVFSASGGTSTGSVGTTTDNGDGTYTATFTGVLAGTATTIGATIDGQPVTTSLPAVSVLPGPISTAMSLVSVGSANVISGTTTVLTLQARDAAGNTITSGGANVTFTAAGGTGTSTGTISATTDHGNGTYSATFTGITVGTAATISALINDVTVTSTPAAAITVVTGAIASVAVTPATITLDALDATQQFAAQAFDANGNPVSGATFTWQTSNDLIASVDATGLATAVANGTVTISATADGVTGGTPLRIAQAVATVILSVPSAPLTSLNATHQFTVAASDRLGNPVVPQPAFTWSSLNTLVAGVNQSGLATSRANGTTKIVAASGGVADTSDLSVQQVVATVVVTPANVALTVGGQVPLRAEARDAGGSLVAGETFTWSSDLIAVATVDANGLVTAVAAGTASISATTAGSITGTARVSVSLLVTATQLVFIQQPPSPLFFGEPFTVQVAAQDDAGNIVTGHTADIVLSETGSSNALSQLRGTLTQPLVNGVATFTDLFLDGTDTTALQANAGGLPSSQPTNTFMVVEQITIPTAEGGPYFAGVDTLLDRIYVSNTNGRSATIIDGTAPKAGGTITKLGSNPGWEGVNPEARQVYISDFVDGTVAIIDEEQEAVLATIPVGASATQPAVDAAGNAIFVPAQRQEGLSLVIVDLLAAKETGAVPIGGTVDRAAGTVRDPATGLVWIVIESQNMIKAVDPVQRTVVEQVSVGEGPYGIALDTKLRRLYVTLSRSDQVAVIDLTDRPTLLPQAIRVGLFPQGLSVDSETGRVFVANFEDGIKPGTVMVIDGAQQKVVKTITVRAGPGDAEYNTRNRLVYVPNGNDNSISIVKPN